MIFCVLMKKKVTFLQMSIICGYFLIFVKRMWFFDIGHDEQPNDFITPGSFVAIAAPQLSKDTV